MSVDTDARRILDIFLISRLLRHASNTSTSSIHKFEGWSRRVKIVPLITSISHQKHATVKGTMTDNNVWCVIHSWNAAEFENESLISISISISISRPGVDVTAVSSIVLQELHHAHRLIGSVLSWISLRKNERRTCDWFWLNRLSDRISMRVGEIGLHVWKKEGTENGKGLFCDLRACVIRIQVEHKTGKQKYSNTCVNK